jgi:TonB family protein
MAVSESLLPGGFTMAHRLPIARRLIAFLVLICCAGFAAAQAKVDRVRVSAGYAETLLVKKVAPEYPAEAKAKKIQGLVVLRVFAGKGGDVERVELVSGEPLLVPAAIEAVRQWKYKAYLFVGQPVKFETQVTVNFTLTDAPSALGIAGDVPGGAFSGVIGVVQNPVPTEGIPQRVRVSASVEQGMLVKKVAPEYPAEAKDKRIQGQVVLSVIVGKDGEVEHVALVSGHPLLAPPAIASVKQWKYKPYLLNGAPVEVETQVMVSFTLMS